MRSYRFIFAMFGLLISAASYADSSAIYVRNPVPALEKVADREMPKDVYQGEDKEVIINDVLIEWNKVHPDIPILAKGFLRKWKREKRIEYVLGDPVKHDYSRTVIWVIRKTSEDIATQHLADVKVDHANGDKRTVSVPEDLNANFTWHFPLSKVKDPNSDIGGGGSGLGGLFGGLISQLILGTGLILCGLLLAAPLISSKVTASAPIYEKLTPFRALIGVATLAIGVIWLVMSLMSPLSSILPIAAAIISGLYLGLELLMKKPANSASDQLGEKAGAAADAAVVKAQALLEKNASKLKMLEKLEVPIGLSCLVLGVLHIVVGNMTFL